MNLRTSGRGELAVSGHLNADTTLCGDEGETTGRGVETAGKTLHGSARRLIREIKYHVESRDRDHDRYYTRGEDLLRFGHSLRVYPHLGGQRGNETLYLSHHKSQ